MCRRVIWATIVACLVFGGTAWSQPPFYYGSNGPIYLDIDSTKVQIKLNDEYAHPSGTNIIDEIDRIAEILDSDILEDNFLLCSLTTSQGYTAFIDSLKSLDYIYLAEPYYVTGDSSAFPVSQSFVAAFNPSVTIQTIDSINASLHVQLVQELEALDNVYLLNNTDSTSMGVLDLANLYQNMDEVDFAHPNFSITPEPCSYKVYDYYAEYETQLKRIIGYFNNITVWDFAGLDRPIVIAVIDCQVEPHEDLPAERILPGYDAIKGEDSAILPIEGHGMACAGIIGASHTTDSIEGKNQSSGVFSLDPHVKILPIRIFDNKEHGVNVTKTAEAIAWAYHNGADILNCSWEYLNPYYEIPVINLALWGNYRFGRNGLGAPIFFSAGNNAEQWSGTVGYPANLDYCFSVGAITPEDTLFKYSMRGPGLDAVAPSGGFYTDLWSLDRMDSIGYNDVYKYTAWDCPSFEENNVNYNCHFGGTSGACPMATGIAALLLSRDSTLTADQIYDILRNSAVKELASGTINPPDTLYGYGRLDAFWAILSIVRGDANNDARINVGDALYIVNFAMKNGPPPKPFFLTGDANCDGYPDIGDAVYLINYVFKNGPAPSICNGGI